MGSNRNLEIVCGRAKNIEQNNLLILSTVSATCRAVQMCMKLCHVIWVVAGLYKRKGAEDGFGA